MILIFGGTTEGRSAAKVLDESGAAYWYSTRGDLQDIQLAHGIRITGGMDETDMADFCRGHDIRLLVDAAHPFAENLHQNIVNVASQINVPVVRYDRIYPPHDGDLVWCRDYADAIHRLGQHGVSKLLALTGVNTIAKLQPLTAKSHSDWLPGLASPPITLFTTNKMTRQSSLSDCAPRPSLLRKVARVAVILRKSKQLVKQESRLLW